MAVPGARHPSIGLAIRYHGNPVCLLTMYFIYMTLQQSCKSHKIINTIMLILN